MGRDADEEAGGQPGPGRPPRNNRTTRVLCSLMNSGLLQHGKGALFVDYYGSRLLADLSPEGDISYEGVSFTNPSALALYMKQSINPALKQDKGWNSVIATESGRSLKELRDDYSRLTSGRSTNFHPPQRARREEATDRRISASPAPSSKAPESEDGDAGKIEPRTLEEKEEERVPSASSVRQKTFQVSCCLCRGEDNREKPLRPCARCGRSFHSHCLEQELETDDSTRLHTCSICLQRQFDAVLTWLVSIRELCAVSDPEQVFPSLSGSSALPPTQAKESEESPGAASAPVTLSGDEQKDENDDETPMIFEREAREESKEEANGVTELLGKDRESESLENGRNSEPAASKRSVTETETKEDGSQKENEVRIDFENSVPRCLSASEVAQTEGVQGGHLQDTPSSPSLKEQVSCLIERLSKEVNQPKWASGDLGSALYKLTTSKALSGPANAEEMLKGVREGDNVPHLVKPPSEEMMPLVRLLLSLDLTHSREVMLLEGEYIMDQIAPQLDKALSEMDRRAQELEKEYDAYNAEYDSVRVAMNVKTTAMEETYAKKSRQEVQLNQQVRRKRRLYEAYFIDKVLPELEHFLTQAPAAHLLHFEETIKMKLVAITSKAQHFRQLYCHFSQKLETVRSKASLDLRSVLGKRKMPVISTSHTYPPSTSTEGDRERTVPSQLVARYEKFFLEKLFSLREERNKLVSTLSIITDFLEELKLSESETLGPTIDSTVTAIELLDQEIRKEEGGEAQLRNSLQLKRRKTIKDMQSEEKEKSDQAAEATQAHSTEEEQTQEISQGGTGEAVQATNGKVSPSEHAHTDSEPAQEKSEDGHLDGGSKASDVGLVASSSQ